MVFKVYWEVRLIRKILDDVTCSYVYVHVLLHVLIYAKYLLEMLINSCIQDLSK